LLSHPYNFPPGVFIPLNQISPIIIIKIIDFPILGTIHPYRQQIEIAVPISCLANSSSNLGTNTDSEPLVFEGFFLYNIYGSHPELMKIVLFFIYIF
jgi:hypothetical protein